MSAIHRSSLLILFTSLFVQPLLADPLAAASAQCTKETKDVRIGSEVARFAQYRCAAAGTGAAVNVEFLRLSEVAVSGLLMNELWPEIEDHLGGVRLVENAVLGEARGLFEKFGKLEDGMLDFFVQSQAPEIGRGTEQKYAGQERRQLVYLSFPKSDGYAWENLSLPDDSRVIKTSTRWPPGWRFYYGAQNAEENCKSPDEFACVLLWRPMSSEDIELADVRLREESKIVAEELRREGIDVDHQTETEPAVARMREQLRLISFLTKEGWPKDFITILGSYSDCGGGYGFVYYPRQLVLDVALIENLSSDPVDIGDVLGNVTAGGVRLADSTETAEPSGTKIGLLEPGARAIVPLRINFVASRGLRKTFETSLDFSRAFYAKIERLPPGALVGKGPPGALRKSKDEYRAPEMPYLGAYVFGPELSMTGLIVNGERVLLEERSANFIELTASTGEGSCPYLYARDDETGRWVNFGKIIHAADSPDKVMTEEIPLNFLATRFRIVEEELEVSHVDRVSLILETAKGQSIILEPAIGSLKSIDRRYVEIPAGRSLELSFEVPPHVRSDEVLRSRLSVTGFYRQHSSLMVSGIAE